MRWRKWGYGYGIGIGMGGRVWAWAGDDGASILLLLGPEIINEQQKTRNICISYLYGCVKEQISSLHESSLSIDQHIEFWYISVHVEVCGEKRKISFSYAHSEERFHPTNPYITVIKYQ